METATRFAPSPTGLLHPGHAFAAQFAHSKARANGGRFLLRIEDIDSARCRPEFTAAILRDLAWLELGWDAEPLIQSTRLPLYAAALENLRTQNLLYPCFCSRAAIAREAAASASAPHGAPRAGPDGTPLYPGTCRFLSPAERAERIAAGAPHVWRLDMPRARRRVPSLIWREAGAAHEARPEAFGDVVLGRRDAPASYHLAATLDDAAQGITLVTRGADLRPAAGLHRLLQALLDLPAPEYAHHPLLAGLDGRRLAKRAGAPSIAALREQGMAPQAVLARLRDLPEIVL